MHVSVGTMLPDLKSVFESMPGLYNLEITGNEREEEVSDHTFIKTARTKNSLESWWRDKNILWVNYGSFYSRGKENNQHKNTDLERPIQLEEGWTNILAAVSFTGKSQNMWLHLINLILEKKNYQFVQLIKNPKTLIFWNCRCSKYLLELSLF